jgi:ATP-dependent DNA helicase RecQ
LAGRSALAVFPTGAGKSLCYQLPALLLDGLTLVVSPLIALMTDQVDKLRRRGIGAARIDSTLADDELEEVFAGIADGSVKLLYVSPERLAGTAFRRRLRGIAIALLAIDEAHCISEWGHNFRPDYLKLASLARRLRAGRVLALTATATAAVARDIRREFRIARTDHFQAPANRPNLRLGVTACTPADKDAALVGLLREVAGPAIVYATTRKATECVAAMLQHQGFAARVYHAGCAPADRAAAQDAFMRNETRIIVATIAFGMGIDKPDIRAVIHYHLPKCLEGYCQEIGRAGRDGLPACCELLADAGDTATLENFIHAATPSPQGLKNLLDRLLRLAAPGGSFAVSPYQLSRVHDMREETVTTVLAYLELLGVIERTGSYHDFLRVVPVRRPEQILAGRPRREQRLIRTLIGAAEQVRGGWHFQVQETAAATGLARPRIVAMLDALAAAGEVRVTQRGLRVVYQTRRGWDGAAAPVIADLARRFGNRARFEHGRIATMVEFVRSRRCRAVALAAHFGQRIAPCGTCDRCRNRPPVKLGAAPPPTLTAADWAAMSALRDERHPALATPLQLARFLCGIPSPAATDARLHLRPEFGLWHLQRFADVVRMLEA